MLTAKFLNGNTGWFSVKKKNIKFNLRHSTETFPLRKKSVWPVFVSVQLASFTILTSGIKNDGGLVKLMMNFRNYIFKRDLVEVVKYRN